MFIFLYVGVHKMCEDMQGYLVNNMVDNLAVLRMKLQLKQVELADMVGISRQTLLAIEKKQRPLSWSIFLSLLFVFFINEETRSLLGVMGIYTDEFDSVIKLSKPSKF